MYNSYLLLLLLPFLNPVFSVTIGHPRYVHAAGVARRDGPDHRAMIRNAVERSEGKEQVKKSKKKRACQAPMNVTSTTTTAQVAGGTMKSSSAAAGSSSSVTSIMSSAAAGSTSKTSASPMMSRLFPLGTGSAGWTTCTESTSALSFTGALKPLTAGSLPSTGTAPDGQSALVATYPTGTFQLSGSGYSFYSEGQHSSVLVSGAKEVLFSYSVFFPTGFQFVKGGKMPGLYGGTSLSQAKSCSGGRQNDRDQCFSARLMWRTDGAGEFYNYYPTSVNQAGGYCSTPPYSICDTTYGDSIGRGIFSWSTGTWTTVAQRLKLNDVGASNGEQELFVNGESVLKLSNLQIAVQADTKIYGIMAQTFFGGSDSTWASPQDQSAYFKDWSLAVMA